MFHFLGILPGLVFLLQTEFELLLVDHCLIFSLFYSFTDSSAIFQAILPYSQALEKFAPHIQQANAQSPLFLFCRSFLYL